MLRKTMQAGRKPTAARALIAMQRRECNHEFLAATCDGRFGDSEFPNGLLNRAWGRLSLRKGEGTVRVDSNEFR